MGLISFLVLLYGEEKLAGHIHTLVDMLLNQFRTGAAASALQGTGRDGLVRNGAVAAARKRRVSLQVRATSSSAADGAGSWLSKSTGLGSNIGNKVGGFVDNVLHGSGTPKDGNEMVVYKGTVVIMKKIFKLDLIDRGADLMDDTSDLLGKKVSFQLVSDEIDPSMPLIS